ncbi:DUF1329 domain-containing protein [Pseudomonas fluorescens]|uniref:Outer membrane lipoprotein-sorting protein n=1 Tax=Pseudomonas fluorescens TaxID=294 RepID=A0A0F4V773_PSEFL|nr:DUF1329 domain-containing protein [Pseudomonas fluorescens]KJZ64584.1 hypothetical protein VD17_17060 [Pseudomonas fluorescens]
MFKLDFSRAAILAAALVASPQLFAQVSVEQVARLGKDLTPIGAQTSANADGSIPAWTGGLAVQSNAIDPAIGYKDPFAADKPLFTITAANAEKYRDKLTAGELAMLKRYPDTWKMSIYPTRRSASYPSNVYGEIKANATNAKLVDEGNGVSNVKHAQPFPIPQSGMEVMWNHLMRYRGTTVKRVFASATPQRNGDFVVAKAIETMLFNQDVSDSSKSNGNILFYFLQLTLAPARVAGESLLLHESVNQVVTPRQGWLYSAGQRRVRRTPSIAYDTPADSGLTTVDSADMFSGALDRYSWKLIGKSEIYVPYNNYRFAAKTNKYSDIIRPGHINPELPRYELHRVWHVRAELKPGQRHIYKQRDFYLDEDSYQILTADHFDNHDVLWRHAESYTINYYDQPLVWTVGDASYDLIAGRYSIGNLSNEEVAYEFGVPVESDDFTPAKLRQASVR